MDRLTDGQSLGVVFQTSSPFETPGLMAELVRWTNKALTEAEHHPLLIVGTFVVRFLAVHPFQDGNGRLARVLTTLLLLRSGYSDVPYSSLERIVEENKDEYYRTLKTGAVDARPGRVAPRGVVALLPALPPPTEGRADS